MRDGWTEWNQYAPSTTSLCLWGIINKQMAFCLMAPSHCLYLCSPIANKTFTDISEWNFKNIHSRAHMLSKPQWFKNNKSSTYMQEIPHKQWLLCGQQLVSFQMEEVGRCWVTCAEIKDKRNAICTTKSEIRGINSDYSLWPSDAIWRHRSGLILAQPQPQPQVMACCLMAPSR